MMPDGSGSYVLRGGEEAARRLKLLARVMGPTTKTLFRRVGLTPGICCLDAGCGIGAVSLKLARWVGPGGQVVGIDPDKGCLAVARQEAVRLGLAPVFRGEAVGDLRDESAYDLVYARFLLTHLPDPVSAIERMVNAALPGGLVVVEDIEFAAHFSYPPCPAFERYVSLYQQAVLGKGGDPNIGPRLPGLLMDAGLRNVDLAVVQPTFRRGPGKRMAQVTMEHIRAAVQSAGLASPEEVDGILAGLDQFARSRHTILSLPRIIQVWGRRA